MDVHVIEEGMGHRTMTCDGDAESNDGNKTLEHDQAIPEPHIGMEFGSDDAATTFYEDYARRVGFRSRAGQCTRSRDDGAIIGREFVCSKDGLKRRATDSCDAMLRIEVKKGEGKWVVTKFIKDHSHSLIGLSKLQYLRPRRHFAGAAKNISETYQGVGVIPDGVMYVSMEGNNGLQEPNRGIRNETNHFSNSCVAMNSAIRVNMHKRTLGRDAQNLLEYFKKMQAQNPGFFYAIQLDEENHMANAFWADARSRIAYSHFGDAVSFDTNYKVNQYRVPFAPFTGVNHHGQMISFGCAILLDEAEASFIWLFKTFLTAMNDQHPVSIITDRDGTMQVAVSQVFPETRHCFNKWNVLREGKEKLAHVCFLHPSFQLELYNCINLTETIEEFELSWSCILDKYGLRGQEWLQSLYDSRAQWVPVYFRDSFFGVISQDDQGFATSFLDGYVDQQTTLPMFFRQHERALESSFERELEADFDTICTTPVLRTPSPMEKQAASLYTKKVFTKFQEELVETFVYTANRIEGDATVSTFRVAKFEDHKEYKVTFNYGDMIANCSCQMFEYSGILCRHVLTVFTVTNVLTLPAHYILGRWTRNAKEVHGIDQHYTDTELLTSRFNNLCLGAMKYAQEGAVSMETYTAALAALREGMQKVTDMKKMVAKVSPPASSQVRGVSYNDKKTCTADQRPLLWPRQEEVNCKMNLNDVSASAQSGADLSSLPRMAPIFLQRDDGPHGNMALLPSLKSMTWAMENKNSTPGNKVAVINLKLQDYGRTPCAEFEVKFNLSRATLEPMLKSMACISEQLSTPTNRLAVINLKQQ
ncbi:Protein FAR1-RELATED SEQUENCE 3 [Linum grandiflorum]